jgi:hypothetical protein
VVARSVVRRLLGGGPWRHACATPRHGWHASRLAKHLGPGAAIRLAADLKSSRSLTCVSLMIWSLDVTAPPASSSSPRECRPVQPGFRRNMGDTISPTSAKSSGQQPLRRKRFAGQCARH